MKYRIDDKQQVKVETPVNVHCGVELKNVADNDLISDSSDQNNCRHYNEMTV